VITSNRPIEDWGLLLKNNAASSWAFAEVRMKKLSTEGSRQKALSDERKKLQILRE